MKRFLLLSITLLLVTNAISQDSNLNDYSYVIVPEQFDFLKGADQYQINSMTKFYFEKNGFNAYMANVAPNANRCDGLYADVEVVRSIIGTKLQVVLKDCNEREVYRGPEGRSKYKEYKKAFQDALRKSFSGLEVLRVKQKEVVLLEDKDNLVQVSTNKITVSPQKIAEPNIPLQIATSSVIILPEAKFSNYSYGGKTFLLRKTNEGFSLYEESSAANDGLLLKGNIVVTDNKIKYVDSAGNVVDADFDTSGNLSIKEGEATKVYQSVD